jgi:hypothetical protein
MPVTPPSQAMQSSVQAQASTYTRRRLAVCEAQTLHSRRNHRERQDKARADRIAFQEKSPPGKEHSDDHIQLGYVQGLRMVAN